MSNIMVTLNNWSSKHLDEAEIALGTRKRIPVVYIEQEPTDGPVDYDIYVRILKDPDEAFEAALHDQPF